MAKLAQVSPPVIALVHPTGYLTDPNRTVHDDITTLPEGTAGIAKELRSHAEHRLEDGLDHRNSIVGAPAQTLQWGLVTTLPLPASRPLRMHQRLLAAHVPTQWQQKPKSFAEHKTGIA